MKKSDVSSEIETVVEPSVENGAASANVAEATTKTTAQEALENLARSNSEKAKQASSPISVASSKSVATYGGLPQAASDTQKTPAPTTIELPKADTTIKPPAVKASNADEQSSGTESRNSQKRRIVGLMLIGFFIVSCYIAGAGLVRHLKANQQQPVVAAMADGHQAQSPNDYPAAQPEKSKSPPRPPPKVASPAKFVAVVESAPVKVDLFAVTGAPLAASERPAGETVVTQIERELADETAKMVSFKPFAHSRQNWVRMNGTPWPKDDRPVSLTRLLTALRKSLVKAV